MSLLERVALVTGSGRNIGRAAALALANEGADLVVHARSNREEVEAVAQEVRRLGRRALPLLADLGEQDQLEAMLARVLQEFSRVDILINNAVIRQSRPLLETTPEEWRRLLAVDLDAAFLLARGLAPGMLAQEWGRIINIGGLTAMEGRSGSVALSAAKMGVIGLTRALAHELGPQGVLTNCIVPGAINGNRRPTGGAAWSPASRTFPWATWAARRTSPRRASFSAPRAPPSPTAKLFT